jgi:hypothetical protein
MRKKLLHEINKLRNLYYLLQYLRDEGRAYLNKLSTGAVRMPRAGIPEVLKSLRAEIAELKARVGCRLTDAQIAEVVTRMTAPRGAGYTYVSKRFIDKHWVTNYAEAFPRWPHIPGHALVVFDTDIGRASPYATLVAEEQLFRDTRLIWGHIRAIITDGKDFRTRPKSKQQDLYSYMRTLATLIYHFLEAYLNGIAYNCFQDFHNSLDLEEHDLLSEWNSKDKCPRFVPFEKKMKKYPVTCGKHTGRKVPVVGDKHLEFLLTEGRAIRDALTHPSPYINWDSKDPTKTYRMLTINPDQLKQLFQSAIVYVRRTEESLGREVTRSMPWLGAEGLDPPT